MKEKRKINRSLDNKFNYRLLFFNWNFLINVLSFFKCLQKTWLQNKKIMLKMVKPIYVPSILSYFFIKIVLFDVDLFPPCFDMESATCHYSYTILHIYLPARGQLELPARGQTNRAARSACSHGSCSIGTARYVTMHCKYSILNHPCY